VTAQRPPHPATVVQRRAAPEARGERPPHPATVTAQRPPHPATVVQRRAASEARVERPPHPATVTAQRPPHPATVVQRRAVVAQRSSAAAAKPAETAKDDTWVAFRQRWRGHRVLAFYQAELLRGAGFCVGAAVFWALSRKDCFGIDTYFRGLAPDEQMTAQRIAGALPTIEAFQKAYAQRGIRGVPDAVGKAPGLDDELPDFYSQAIGYGKPGPRSGLDVSALLREGKGAGSVIQVDLLCVGKFGVAAGTAHAAAILQTSSETYSFFDPNVGEFDLQAKELPDFVEQWIALMHKELGYNAWYIDRLYAG
jgi:Yersinia/Haemophilus virulence surface antigen